MKNFYKKSLLLIIIFLFSISVVHASDVSVVAPQSVIGRQYFTVSVNLNTDGNPINSLDVSLSYPRDLLSFKGYKEGGSIKKLWIVSPIDNSGVIHFAGIIPGGVGGVYDPDKNGLQAIPLVELIFSPKADGQGEFVITHSDILRNDGQGTPLIHENNNATITVSGTAMGDDQIALVEKSNKDTEPPEPLTIKFIEAGFFSRTPSMISFFTSDADSGVEKYQMYTSNNSWKDVVSPLPIQKAILKKHVVIRAIDFYGNIRQDEVEIPGILSPLQLLAIIIFGFGCYIIVWVIKRKR